MLKLLISRRSLRDRNLSTNENESQQTSFNRCIGRVEENFEVVFLYVCLTQEAVHEL